MCERIKNTKHWKLQMTVGWVKKPIEQKKCTSCGGEGLKHGTGWRNMYGDEDPNEKCDVCYGRGTVNVEQREPQPEVPKKVSDIMQQAWCRALGIWKLPPK
jgi:hypothetical protein